MGRHLITTNTSQAGILSLTVHLLIHQFGVTRQNPSHNGLKIMESAALSAPVGHVCLNVPKVCILLMQDYSAHLEGDKDIVGFVQHQCLLPSNRIS